MDAGCQKVPVLARSFQDFRMNIFPHGSQDIPALVGLYPSDHAHEVFAQVWDLVQAQLFPEGWDILDSPASIGPGAMRDHHDISRRSPTSAHEIPLQPPFLIMALEQHHPCPFTHLVDEIRLKIRQPAVDGMWLDNSGKFIDCVEQIQESFVSISLRLSSHGTRTGRIRVPDGLRTGAIHTLFWPQSSTSPSGTCQ